MPIADRTTISERVGEIEQGIAVAEAKLKRLRAMSERSLVPQSLVVETEAELEGLKRRREVVRDARLAPEVLRAPIDGVIGARQIRVGDYVLPGSRLFTLVPLHALYVTANFKETQTGRMRPGQPVTIEVDAFGSTKFHGTVESFAPGSGSSFSLLPFEPGTGNFTKIVQRVPVRIDFDPNQNVADMLRPGLSVTATVMLKP